jgi:hypothetical protein
MESEIKNEILIVDNFKKYPKFMVISIGEPSNEEKQYFEN